MSPTITKKALAATFRRSYLSCTGPSTIAYSNSASPLLLSSRSVSSSSTTGSSSSCCAGGLSRSTTKRSVLLPAVRVQLSPAFSDRDSLEIMPLPLIGQELALVGDPHAVALRMLNPLQVHPEVDGAHDAIAELLVDQSLYSGAIDLRNLVYPVDGGVHRNIGVE